MSHLSLGKSLLLLSLLAGGWSVAQAQGVRPPAWRPHPRMRRSRFDASRPPVPHAPPHPGAFYPLVALRILNRAYVRELSRRRQLRRPLVPASQVGGSPLFV